MKIEMHSHTNYSRGKKILYDGVEPPEAMVRRAKEIGLEALAITDHNTMLGIKKAKAAGKKYGVMIIQGEEMHSQQGHVTALGIQETIRPGLSILETVDQVHSLADAQSEKAVDFLSQLEDHEDVQNVYTNLA